MVFLKNEIEQFTYKGVPCHKMLFGNYSAIFCAELGGLMLRFRDEKNNYEILRFDENASMQTVKENICLYGLPTLFLPNRFHKGILKTSDNTYQLPINEPDFNNFIHGFLHMRAFKVTETVSCDEYCKITSEYNYDENDDFFEYLPLCFKAQIIFTLSDKGIEYNLKITNLSKSVLPVVAGSHTAINLPFCENSKKEDLRIKVNVDERVVLNKNLVSTGEFIPLNDYDLKYKNGELNPLTTSIDNDMYSINSIDKDGNFFNGVEIFDDKLKHCIRYEAGSEYKYWLFWNHWGDMGFCCPEPMSALIDAPNIPLSPEVTGYTELKTGETWTGYQRISTF